MIRAIIDIGTNSVRLVVAKREAGGEWKILKKGMNPSRLGEGMGSAPGLTSAACQRTLEAVEGFVETAKLAGADEIKAYGTSIMRDAPQGKAFGDLITDKTGIPVKILPGEMEAFYSYLGAVGLSSSVSVVTDIGGGSTEMCMGFGAAIGFRKSFPIGCVRCSDMFDTTTARGIGELKKHCFQEFQHSDDLAPVKRWIAVGGTATSIAAILQEMEVYDSEKIQDYVIHQEDVTGLLRDLYKMSYEERCHLKGLRADRADIIVAGVAIVDSLMEYFALSELTVSDRGLSEGLLDEDEVKPEK